MRVGDAVPVRGPALPTARVLTIAGSDSGGGAGIQADLKTMLAHGVHGMSVITAVTAQNSVGVQGVWSLPAAAVAAQFRSVVDDIGVDAVKIGMLGTAETCVLVAELLATLPAGVPVVLDPVAVSKHGDPLIDADARGGDARPGCSRSPPWRRPNLDEARTLVGLRPAPARPTRRGSGTRCSSSGRPGCWSRAATPTGDPVDVLVGRDDARPYLRRGAGRQPRTPTAPAAPWPRRSPPGSPRGDDVPTAVAAAKAYVTGAIAAGFALGAGIGPTDHLWELRTALP